MMVFLAVCAVIVGTPMCILIFMVILEHILRQAQDLHDLIHYGRTDKD